MNWSEDDLKNLEAYGWKTKNGQPLDWNSNDEASSLSIVQFIAEKMPDSSLAKKLLASNDLLEYPKLDDVMGSLFYHCQEEDVLVPWLATLMSKKALHTPSLSGYNILSRAFVARNNVAVKYLLNHPEKKQFINDGLDLEIIGNEIIGINRIPPSILSVMNTLLEDNIFFLKSENLAPSTKSPEDVSNFLKVLAEHLHSIKNNNPGDYSIEDLIQFFDHLFVNAQKENISNTLLMSNSSWLADFMRLGEPRLIDWIEQNVHKDADVLKQNQLLIKAIQHNKSPEFIKYMVNTLKLNVDEHIHERYKSEYTPLMYCLSCPLPTYRIHNWAKLLVELGASITISDTFDGKDYQVLEWVDKHCSTTTKNIESYKWLEEYTRAMENKKTLEHSIVASTSKKSSSHRL